MLFELGKLNYLDIGTKYVIVAGCAKPRNNDLCAARRLRGAAGSRPAQYDDVTSVDAAVPIRRSVHSALLGDSSSSEWAI